MDQHVLQQQLDRVERKTDHVVQQLMVIAELLRQVLHDMNNARIAEQTAKLKTATDRLAAAIAVGS